MASNKKQLNPVTERQLQWMKAADKRWEAAKAAANRTMSKFYALTAKQAMDLENALEADPQWRRMPGDASTAFAFHRDAQSVMEEATSVSYRIRTKQGPAGKYLVVVGDAELPGQDEWVIDELQTQINARNRAARARKQARKRVEAFLGVDAVAATL